ncbi:MAG: DUF4831 family protein [Marinilabilia sp.]
MKHAYILLTVMILAACTTPKNLSRADFVPVNDSVPPTEGVFYHLPVTVIEVEVTARKTIQKRGPFYRYSQRYLDLDDIITEDQSYWEITDAEITTKGKPDPERLYRISAKGTPAGAAVNLTPDGTLKGLNLSRNKKAAQIPAEKRSGEKAPQDTAKSVEDISFDDVPFTEEQLIKTSSAATAEEVADEIYNLRDSRRQLLESDMSNLPPDDGAYKRILDNINKLEEQYLSLFKGKVETITETRTFSFIPDTSSPLNQVLFRFSAEKGFSEAIDMSGTPVYIDINDENLVPKNNTVPSNNGEERSGLVYCRPAKATVKVIDRTVLLEEKDVLLGQFGSLHQLPPELLDDGGTSVKLDPNTGAILEIETNQ